MYRKIILYKEGVINEHMQKLGQFKAEQAESEKKIHNAYQELKNITYNNDTTFFEVQSKIIYLRDYISTLKKEVNFYANYIEHETQTIRALNMDLEKFKFLQNKLELEKKLKAEREEEEEMLELLNLKRSKT